MKTKLNTKLVGILFGIFLFSTTLFAKEDIVGCDIRSIGIYDQSCEPDGSYTLCLSLVGEDLPANPNDLKLVIGHETIDWEFDYELVNLDGTLVRICVNLFGEDRTNLDVFVRLESGCTFTANNLYSEPTCEPAPPCIITDFSARTPSCLWYDVYEVIFDVVGEGLPYTDNGIEVEIDGTTYQVTRYTRISDTEAEVRVTVLRDLQEDVDVTITLNGDCSLTKLDLYDEPDCGDEPICRITDFSARTPSCLWYDVYEVIFDVVGENLPFTDNDIEVQIDGISYQVTRYNLVSDTEAEVRVTVLRDKNEDVDVTITLNEDCSLTKQDMYDEPDCGNEPICSITDFTVRTPACLYYDVYEVIFDVVGENLPFTDNDIEVQIDGISYQVTRYNLVSDTEAEVRVTVLRDTNEDVDVTITLNEDCSLTKQDMYDEPDCGDLPECSISDFTARSPACLYYDVYEVIFDVAGENLPINENEIEVQIDGISYQVTRYNRTSETEAEVWVTVPRDRNEDVDVTITLNSDCSLTKQNVYDEPDCGDDPTLPQGDCDINSMSFVSVECLQNDTYSLCLRIEGSYFPGDDELKVVVDHQPYPVSNYGISGSGENMSAVICVYGIESNGQQDVEVFVQLESGCSIAARNFFDEPDCNNARLGREEILDFQVYPNPNNGQFSIEIPEVGDAELTVLDQMGRTTYRQDIRGNTLEKLNLPQLPEGVYFVRIRNGNYLLTKRIMIKY